MIGLTAAPQQKYRQPENRRQTGQSFFSHNNFPFPDADAALGRLLRDMYTGNYFCMHSSVLTHFTLKSK